VADPGGDVHEQAADEMRKRVEQLLGARGLNVALGRSTPPASASSGNGMPSWDSGTASVIYDDARPAQLIKDCSRA